MQLTSAWAVGSVVFQTVLCVTATTSPFRTITDPNGDWPAAMPSRVFWIARRMKSSSVIGNSSVFARPGRRVGCAHRWHQYQWWAQPTLHDDGYDPTGAAS